MQLARAAVRAVKLPVKVWSPASEWVTQPATLWRVVGVRWHMTGQARVASHRQPLPIHLCLPPFLPIQHTLILHTSICYAHEGRLLASSTKNYRQITKLQESITKKTLRRVPVQAPGNNAPSTSNRTDLLPKTCIHSQVLYLRPYLNSSSGSL